MTHHLDRIGQQVGDYRLLRWLGEGGFGHVYLAEQVRDHSQVAIKLLPVRLSRSEELKAFINEARTIRLQHAHIVPLLDFGISQEEIPYLVMEYAAGGTLRGRYPQGSQVPLPLVVNYAQQIGSALQYAHAQRLIHRDVKPQNMLLRIDGTVLLSDFGLVTIAYSSDALSPHQEAVGTIAYMAPEQIQQQARAESDQYSLGVVVYEWIAGRCPFEGTAAEIAMQHVMKAPPSLVAQVPGLSTAVEQVVLKALAKDPKDRFVCVQDFAAALEETIRERSDPSSSFISQQSLPSVIPDEYKTSPIDNNESVLSPHTSLLPVPSSLTSLKPAPRAPAALPQVDWGDALMVPVFYGREQELAFLSQRVVQDHCRVVSVLGMGGIGKSALVISMTHRLLEDFEVVIVRSLRDAPSCETLLDDCLQALSAQPLYPVPDTLEQRISLFLEHLHKLRTLVVLDNLEGLLQEGDVRGHFRSGFEGYGLLLRRVAETSHQSCLLLTSREKPADLRLLEVRYPSVRTLRLAGLDVAACSLLLEEKEVVGTKADQERLIELYGGNPLALKIVAETIVNLFGGKIGPFLAEDTVIIGSITDLLDEQFARVSALERSLLYWLAIVREPTTLDELLAVLVFPPLRIQVLEALDSLNRRALIERGKRPGSFTLQSVVLEYATASLIVETSREIKLGHLTLLIEYSLSQATAHEYVRQTQERLLVTPLLADLRHAYLGQGSGAMRGFKTIEEQLHSLLGQLRAMSDHAQGYGPANLITLLRVQRGHLAGLDLSRLSIRGVYLQGIEMHETSLAGAKISGSVLTEAINATWRVAISPDGRWWAAGSLQGKVGIWEGVRSQTLRWIWQAHVEAVWTLAFSPDGRTLATGGYDTVKLWDVNSHKDSPSGALLWTGRQSYPRMLVFCCDGSLLASGGGDATVRLWDPKNGTNLQTLTQSSQVFAVAFSPDGRLLASGCTNGEMRLWERQKTEPATYVEILSTQTSWVTDLVFAPDGRTLVSAHWDQTVRLWEVGSFRLLDTHTTLHGRYLAWSPDGRTLACGGGDKMIWLWDVEQGRSPAVLLGHTGEVYRLAFAPDSNLLLSGSADSTLRVWNVESRQCLHVMAGYAVSLCDLGWSPDGTHLVSAGSDALVTIWDLGGETPPQLLRDHTRVVLGVGWSPDGKFVASGGWDTTIRLWDATSGVCLQRFGDTALLLCMAWSPDGSKLACGTHQQGVQVWNMTTRSLRFVGQPYQTMFVGIAWSPDGTQLAAGNDDGSVYLWEGTDGAPLQRLQGHQGSVNRVVWSPDGKQLASGSSSGELLVWDVKTGARVQIFAEHSGVVQALAWSPSEDRLISGDSDGMLRWWNVQGGDCVSVQAAHQGTIRALRVSPDGKHLASCGDDGAIMIWDVESAGRLRTLRHDRPYERLNITGIRGLNEAEIASLLALGAIECDSFDPKP